MAISSTKQRRASEKFRASGPLATAAKYLNFHNFHNWYAISTQKIVLNPLRCGELHVISNSPEE
jgi:hypothetical protein